jgi:hypothetical protein
LRSSLCIFREKAKPTSFSTAALDGRVLFWELTQKKHIKLPKSLVWRHVAVALI